MTNTTFFVENFNDYKNAEDTVGQAAFSIGEDLNEALQIANPKFYGQVCRLLGEAACVLLSPGSNSLTKRASRDPSITTKLRKLEELVDASGINRHDFDILLPHLRLVIQYGHIGSHQEGKAISHDDVDEIMVALGSVANQVKHHIYKMRNQLELDKDIFANVKKAEAKPKPDAKPDAKPAAAVLDDSKISQLFSALRLLAAGGLVSLPSLPSPPTPPTPTTPTTPPVSTMMCPLCASEVPLDTMTQCPGGHFMCHSCVQDHVDREMHAVSVSDDAKREFFSRDGDVTCPHPGCTECLHPKEIASALTTPTYDALARFQRECLVDKARAEAGSRAEEEDKCCYCLEETAGYACMPCGNLCLCENEACRNGVRLSGKCPICRNRLDGRNGIVRVFR